MQEAEGANAPPKVLFVENQGKNPESGQNPRKSGKISENKVKMGAQHCWTSKNGAEPLQKNT